MNKKQKVINNKLLLLSIIALAITIVIVFSLQSRISEPVRAQAGTTYYVDQEHPSASDANSGAIDQPWLTINHAATRLQAGDTVLVRAGHYIVAGKNNRWDPALNPRNSGTVNDPITFKSYPGETVVISMSSTTGIDKGPLIGTYDRDYIIWDGFTIIEGTCYHADTGPVVVWYSTGSIIQNCIIEGSYVATDDNHNGIMLIYTSGTIIRDNIIRNTTGDDVNSGGIKLYYNDNVIVEHNDIYGNTMGIMDKEMGTNNIYRRNLIHDNEHKTPCKITLSYVSNCDRIRLLSN